MAFEIGFGFDAVQDPIIDLAVASKRRCSTQHIASPQARPDHDAYQCQREKQAHCTRDRDGGGKRRRDHHLVGQQARRIVHETLAFEHGDEPRGQPDLDEELLYRSKRAIRIAGVRRAGGRRARCARSARQ